MTESIIDQMATPDAMEKARSNYHAKLKSQFEPVVTYIMDQARKPYDELTDQEKILRNTVEHYDPKRDAPDVKIMGFSDWLKAERNA